MTMFLYKGVFNMSMVFDVHAGGGGQAPASCHGVPSRF